MMQRYEALILTVPEITKDELKQMETRLDQLIAESKGSTISFEKWGKYKLSYPVRSNEYGVYCLFRFDAPASVVKEVQDFCSVKFHDIAMRCMVSRIVGNSLAYQRPKSLEEATSARGDMDMFLKEPTAGDMLSAADGRATRGFAKMEPSEEEGADQDEE